jgi:hypothetical protein
VEPAELVVVGEGQVDVRALEVAPAVAPAAEDAVVGAVDLVVLVRPEAVSRGVHPGVHRRGHEAAFMGSSSVDPRTWPGTSSARPSSDGGPLGLELDDVEGELVRPRDGAAGTVGLDSATSAPALPSEELVADGRHVERVAVDDHVLEFDAEGVEQAEGVGPVVGVCSVIGIRASRRSAA